MDLHRQAPADRQIIQTYRNGRFRVSGVIYTGSVLVTPMRTIAWPIVPGSPITPDSMQAVIAEANGLDICLLGCGAQMALIAPDVRAALKTVGLSLDPMDTGAACRTFNVLVAEGRAVIAALMALQ